MSLDENTIRKRKICDVTAKIYSQISSDVMSELYKKYTDLITSNGPSRSDVQKREEIVSLMTGEWILRGNLPLQNITEKVRLIEKVYSFFRYKFDEETGADEPLLGHEAFAFRETIEWGMAPDPKRRISLITGLTQSGKTFITLAVACVNLAYGNIPIFIVKDTKQKNQLITRKNAMWKELRKFLQKEKFPQDLIDIYNGHIYCDSKTTRSERKDMDLMVRKCLDGTESKIIICIHNENHLTRVYKRINEMQKSNFALFIDEAHKMGGYKIQSESGEGDDMHDEEIKYDTVLSYLKILAEKIYLVTATPQDILMCEPNLYTKGVVWLPENSREYVGIKDWEFRIIDDFSTSVSGVIQVDTPEKSFAFSSPPSFLQMMSDLSGQSPIKRVNKFGKEDFHPIIVLAKFELLNERQHMLLESLKSGGRSSNREHQAVIDANWVVMTFNQYGVRLYHESLKGKKITLGSCIVSSGKNGEFLFPTSEIGEVWQWLALNGGVDKFPRILTVAYRSAEEGITFSSTWTGKQETDVNWHITHEYVKMGKSTCSSTLEQSMGRANGNHGDNLTPIIYCTLDDKKKLILGYNLHYEQIQSICTLARDKGDVKVIDVIRELPIFHNRIPKNCYAVKGSRKLIKTKKNPRSIFEDAILTQSTRAIEDLSVLQPDRYNKNGELKKAQSWWMEERKKDYPVISTILDSSDKFARVKQAYNKGGYVKRIVDSFRDVEGESLSEEQLKERCGEKFQYDNYIRWDLGKHAKYHLLNKVGVKFILRAEIIDLFPSFWD